MPSTRAHLRRSISRPIPCLLLALGVVLSGCAPTGVPSSSHGARQTPSATPATELVTPAPWATISCADLASPLDLAGLLTEPVNAIAVPTNRELAADRGPVGFALRQVGGIECEWSNGLQSLTDTGPNADYVGAVLRILPRATTYWAEYTAYYAGTQVGNVNCSGGEPQPGGCTAAALVLDNWVDLQLVGVLPVASDDLIATTRALFDRISRKVEAAEPSSTRWSAPAGTRVLRRDCDQFFSATEARRALGGSAPDLLNGLDGGVSITSSAWKSADTTPCPWITADQMSGGGFHGWLPGGEWAWNETSARAATGLYQPIAVAGLGPHDRAYLRCAPADTVCSVELIIAHNWIEISVYQRGPDQATSSAPSALAALAATTVRHLATP